MYCRIPIENVPICKYLDTKIVHEVIKTTPTLLVIESSMKSTSKMFFKESIQCKDCWVVKSPSKDSQRVIYSHYINVNVDNSSLLSQVTSSAEKGITWLTEQWLKKAAQGGHLKSKQKRKRVIEINKRYVSPSKSQERKVSP